MQPRFKERLITELCSNPETAKYQLEKAFSGLKLDDLVSVQALDNTNQYKYLEFASKEGGELDIQIKERSFATEMESMSAADMDHEILMRIMQQIKPAYKFVIYENETPKETYERFYVKLVEISRFIDSCCSNFESTNFANRVIAPPEITGIYEVSTTCCFCHCDSDIKPPSFRYLGIMANRWKIYQDTKMPSDKVLIGMKGDSHMHSGFNCSISHVKDDQIFFKSELHDKNYYAVMEVEHKE